MLTELFFSHPAITDVKPLSRGCPSATTSKQTMMVTHQESINRGYYIAVRRYEISLRVLKIFHSFVALTREKFSTREEKFRISKRACYVLFIV